jgi:peroxiredoxin
MAQLRHDYDKFIALNAEILVMVPNGPFMIKCYLKKNPTPYLILTDKGSQVAAQYFQVKRFFAVGTPSLFVVDQQGKIAYAHYANSVIEEPSSQEPLAVLAKIAS